MSFNAALSGIRAANTDLQVTGNNIANAGTIGFKSSRAEFGDVYASSLLGGGSNTPGTGVTTLRLRQSYDQGNLKFTQNTLDLAVNGTGFFVVSDAGNTLYTRAGAFGLDKEGNVVSNTGANLRGFLADDAGNLSAILSNLKVDVNTQAPRQTTGVNSAFNLNSNETVLEGVTIVPPIVPTNVFSTSDPKTYNHATSSTVYDSLGNNHVMRSYFVKQKYDPLDATTTPDHWKMYVQIDDRNVGDPDPLSATPTAATMATFDLHFSTNGTLDPLLSDPVLISNWTPLDATGQPLGALGPINGAVAPIPEPAVSSNFLVDLDGSTQYGSPFSVEQLSQNGYATGRLAGLDVDAKGILFARFTNGEAQTLGQVALANFNNIQGLKPVGNTMWAQTFETGDAIVGAPGSSSLGDIKSSALEESNVDLSDQLVSLIIAQRNYQANAKTIETENATTQTILNLR
jgi:flagellar hook protein FlgE